MGDQDTQEGKLRSCSRGRSTHIAGFLAGLQHVCRIGLALPGPRPTSTVLVVVHTASASSSRAAAQAAGLGAVARHVVRVLGTLPFGSPGAAAVIVVLTHHGLVAGGAAAAVHVHRVLFTLPALRPRLAVGVMVRTCSRAWTWGGDGSCAALCS